MSHIPERKQELTISEASAASLFLELLPSYWNLDFWELGDQFYISPKKGGQGVSAA